MKENFDGNTPIEYTVETLCAFLEKNHWTVVRRTGPCVLPREITDRYPDFPEEWRAFLDRVESCVRPDETAWFFCEEDYRRQEEGAFRWDEIERISLEAAEPEEAGPIRAFWDRHLPIFLSVSGDYQYCALRLPDGAVVQGFAPEFEEAEEAAPSLAGFVRALCRGERTL